jgi:hypothetical protein
MTYSLPTSHLGHKKHIHEYIVKTPSEKKQNTQQASQKRTSYQIDMIDSENGD